MTPSPAPDLVPDALQLLLRENPGANKTDATPRAVAPFDVPLPGGGVATLALARYDLIGDLQLRLVRDAGDALVAVAADQLAALRLTLDEALAIALGNLHRAHGAPVAAAWHNLQRVSGGTQAVSSAYFLDRAFWRGLLATHPDGVVAAVPRTDLLVFAPATDTAAVDSLRRGIPGLHAGGGETHRLSSALYLFRDDAWSVLQPAVASAAGARADEA